MDYEHPYALVDIQKNPYFKKSSKSCTNKNKKSRFNFAGYVLWKFIGQIYIPWWNTGEYESDSAQIERSFKRIDRTEKAEGIKQAKLKQPIDDWTLENQEYSAA